VLPDGTSAAITEVIAEEVPVALVYNNISHAVMMATPADLSDFGLGFSLSEGILADRDELMDIGVSESEAGIEVRMAIALKRFRLLRERRRTLAGRTGCGICGVESLEQAMRPVPPVAAPTTVPIEAIYAALAELPRQQAVNQLTRSVHAAAWANRAGQIQLAREDVGRHNALDKLIGAMAWRGIAAADGFALITSRCSVEMVQKAAAVGIPVLVAISAPTALARRVAEACNLTLVALARPDSVLVVTHPERILGTPAGGMP
jgi:formate dehydrogenase accessory protein FdhD